MLVSAVECLNVGSGPDNRFCERSIAVRASRPSRDEGNMKENLQKPHKVDETRKTRQRTTYLFALAVKLARKLKFVNRGTAPFMRLWPKLTLVRLNCL